MGEFNPRPKQKEVLAYTQGYMGVSAVPGSGKTWTLSVLAANLIARGKLETEQEVLIVTLVNSAVDNFSRRIGEFIGERGLLPRVGYQGAHPAWTGKRYCPRAAGAGGAVG